MLNINNQLAVINNPANNVSPQEELVALQTARKALNRIMQDQCADANAKIAHVNVTAFRREGEYHAWYAESSAYYNSGAFQESKVLSGILKERIIGLNKNGVINEVSFNSRGQVMTTKSAFLDGWKLPERRWNGTYSTGTPLFPVVNPRQ